MKHPARIVWPVTSLLLATAALWQPPVARAVPYSFAGSLDATDPTFNRPITLTLLSGVGTHVFYDVQPFSLSLAGSVTLGVNSFASSDGFDDTFLALYRGSFSPASPLTNLIAVDDDGGPGALSLITTTLSANTNYFLVTTTFSNGVTGPYNDSITPANPASVVNVPEPSTWALVGTGAGALLVGILRTHRRRSTRFA